jgi:hypothetical protein
MFIECHKVRSKTKSLGRIDLASCDRSFASLVQDWIFFIVSHIGSQQNEGVV